MLEIKNTGSEEFKQKLNILIYGLPKIGKSTTAITAPKPLIVDLEGGYKFMGQRGKKVDFVTIKHFDEMREVYKLLENSDKYESVIIDPVNELVEMLLNEARSKENPGLHQKQNEQKISMDGWMFIKDKMKAIIKAFRDLDKHVIFVAHMKEDSDDGKMMKRPKIDANLSDELCRHMDIIFYMTQVGSDDNVKRILLANGTEAYFAGDRTGVLQSIVEPDFSKIVDAVVNLTEYSWTLKKEVGKVESEKAENKKNEKKEETKETQKEEVPKTEEKPVKLKTKEEIKAEKPKKEVSERVKKMMEAAEATKKKKEISYGDSSDLFDTICKTIEEEKDPTKRMEMTMREIDENKALTQAQAQILFDKFGNM